MSDSPRDRFAQLHRQGTFVMPNAWDVGSARILAKLGFEAIATTSSGHAMSLGRGDQRVSREELLDHSAAMAAAVTVPVSIDSERCFAATPGEVAATVELIGATGAAGCSIEDYDPASGTIEPLAAAVERVGAAAEAARRANMTLTARAENHIYGGVDLDDTIERLRAFHQAGAAVVYAPGLVEVEAIERLVMSVEAPVNVLLLPGGPTVAELTRLGVRRISTGGALARRAYADLVSAGKDLRDTGAPVKGIDAATRTVIDSASV